MTVVRLGWGGANKMLEKALTEEHPVREREVALLVSFWYLDQFTAIRERLRFRDWAMDSGAFSAHHSGAVIDLAEYIAKCQELLSTDPLLTEVYSLDVIGDHKATLKNTEAMWKAGVPAIPVYHLHEPEWVLKHIAANYPKIALGGVARYPLAKKNDWAAQCFTRVWPKRIHGFGFGSERSLMALPFDSADATNWEIGPAKFGRWMTYGKLSAKGEGLNLRTEVEYYLKLEERVRVRWEREMALLGVSEAPTMRLGVAGTNDDRLHSAFGMEHRPGHKVHTRRR